MNVFVSYSGADSEFARKLAADLKSLGIVVWVDFAELLPSQIFEDEIRKAIGAADVMLVLVSSHSTVSEWVMKEVNAALTGDQRVIPVLIDKESKHNIPPRLLKFQWLDLSDPKDYDIRLRKFASYLLRITSREPRKPAVVEENRVSGEAPGGQFAGIDIDELVKRIATEVAAHMNSPTSQTSTPDTSRGERRDADAKSVFVVMAFTDDMEPVFEGIRDAAQAAGLEAKRVKDVVGDYQISNKLINMLHDAAIVVVDLTHERPNVYFELGYARGIGKTVITTARTGTALHFDVRDWTCTFYSDSRILERSLKERFVIELQDLQQKSR